MNSSDTYIIIPCYNEHSRIVQTIKSVLSYGYNIILVDDASSPSLKETVDGLPVYYLRHILNLGQGASLQTGMNFAMYLNAEIVVHFDSDGQHQAKDINKMIEELKSYKADIVLGSRFLKKEKIKGLKRSRKIILQLARIVNWGFSGLWLSDAHNGFRALNKKAMNAIEIKQNRMAHATEILQLIKVKKLKYKELPVEILYNEYSSNKGQSNWNAINILIDLIFNK